MSTDLVASDLNSQIAQINHLVKAVNSNEPGSREELTKATRQLLFKVESPTEQIWRMLWSEPTHHVVLRIAVELDLFAYLNSHGPSSVEQIATSLKADPVLVRRMCQHLTAMGTLHEHPSTHDNYANTPMAAILAKPEYAMSVKLIEDLVSPVNLSAVPFLKSRDWTSPTDNRDSIMHHYNNCKGQSFFEWGAVNGGNPPMAFQFGQMLTAWSQGRKHWMDTGYYPVQDKLIEGAKNGTDDVFIVDVGGNNGHDLVQLKEKFPKLPGKLLVQDINPLSSEETQKLKGDGIEFHIYDFFTEQPVKGARAYYLHSILHDWSDDDCVKILKRLIPALTRGYSKILLQEMVVPQKDPHWQLTSLDWELLIHFGSKERREAEWKELIEGVSVKVEGEETERKLKVIEMWKHVGSVDSLLECELA